jgi:hypothetical protein
MKRRKWFSIVAALVLVSFTAMPAFAVTPNLVANGNFSAGNDGSFYSDYQYKTEAQKLYDPFVYGVGDNPFDYHSSWASFGDHTSGTGMMMIVNASNTDPTKVVWGQDITIPAFDPTPITEVTLYAGQHMDAGDVLIKYVAGHVWAKIVISGELNGHDGWLISEAHLQGASTLADIPKTKTGNPIPGNFAINEPFDPGVLDTGWFDLGAFPAGQQMLVAAHAKLVHAEVGHMVTHKFCISSGTDTELAGGGDAVVTTANTWAGIDNTINTTLLCDPLARYIWDAALVTAECADIGGHVDFTHDLNIVGTPKSATLMIAADNAFAFHFNDGVETAVNLSADWRTEILLGNYDPPITQGDVGGDPADVVILDGTSTAWSQIYTYNVLSALHTGANVFNATALNADWNTADPMANPAMLIYKLCGTSEEYIIDEHYCNESGWGNGTGFPGANWATYVKYTPTVPVAPTYEFSFWAANSYPTYLANLEVYINGTKLTGSANLSTISPLTATWKQFKFEWTPAPGVTDVTIEIKDAVAQFDGDDFCLDDIKFGIKSI